MKKVIVIGCPGSGKTTFANKLNEITGLPLFYLDLIWHKKDKTNITIEEFDNKVNQILSTSQWIIDGNYNRTIEERIKQSDSIFLFDLPVETCLEGVKERIGKPRNDMPWIESEVDQEFKELIINFPNNSLPKIYELLNKYKKNKQIIIFKSRQEANEYLNYLEK